MNDQEPVSPDPADKTSDRPARKLPEVPEWKPFPITPRLHALPNHLREPRIAAINEKEDAPPAPKEKRKSGNESE